jgi:TP901 family phage tail tape measure protein
MAALTLATLVVKLGADTKQYQSELGAAQGETKKQSNLMGKALAAGVAAGVGLAANEIRKFATEAVDEFQIFEDRMNEVFTLLPDASKRTFEGMSADVRAAGSDMGRLSEETVPALYQALSAGVPKDNVFEFLDVAHQTALGGVTSLEQAVDVLTTTVNAYGAENITAAEASDLLFTAVKGGKTTMDELGRFMFQVIPTASALEVEFGNITAAMATLTAQGTPTRVAATQLRQLLVELSKDGSKASDTFKEMAGVSFAQFIQQGGNVQQALELMAMAAERDGVALQDMFGSVEAGNAALGLTGAGAAKFTQELENAANAEGATAEAADRMNTSLARQEEVVLAMKEQYKLLVGEAISPLKLQWLELQQVVLGNMNTQMEHQLLMRQNADVVQALGDKLGASADGMDRLNTEQSRYTAAAAVLGAAVDGSTESMASAEMQVARLNAGLTPRSGPA